MIIIKNRKLLIPEYERYIGTTADSNSEVLTFRIDRYTQTEMDLSAFTVKADIYRCETEETDRADLEMEVQDNYILLYLYITSGMVAYPGTILIDIKAFNDDGTVKWSSYKGAFYVEDPFVTPPATQENLTELEQLEARINRAVATAGEKAAEVAGAWLDENIAEIEGYVVDKTLSVNNAAADAKSAGNAIGAARNAISAEASTRAVTDNSLQAQINQLVAPSGEAPSAAEVENARVGADGTTYATLGEAIRGQVTDVKSALEYLADDVDQVTNRQQFDWSELGSVTIDGVEYDTGWRNGYYRTDTGAYSNSNSFLRTNGAVTFGADVLYAYATAPAGYGIRVSDFDASGTLVGNYGKATATEVTPLVHFKTEPTHTYKFTLGRWANGDALDYDNSTFLADAKLIMVHDTIGGLKDSIAALTVDSAFSWTEIATTQHPTGWQTGYYRNDNGNYASSNLYLCTDNGMTFGNNVLSFTIEPPTGYAVKVSEYDSASTFVGQIGGMSQPGKLTVSPVVGHIYKYTIGKFANDAPNHNTDAFLATVVMTIKNLKSGVEYKKGRTGDYEFFTVDVSRPLSFSGEVTETSVDTVECVLRLPATYSATGTPTRLVLACHGASGYIQSATNTWYNSNWKAFMDALLDAGYAVFDANVLSTSTGTDQMGYAVGSPLYVNVLKKAYDYIQRNYNVHQQIFAHGTSMGGVGATAFSHAYPELVLAESSFAGRDVLRYLYYMSDDSLSEKEHFAVSYGYASYADLTADKFSHAEGCFPGLSLIKYVNGVAQIPPDRETDYAGWLAYFGEIANLARTADPGIWMGRRAVPYKAWNSWADNAEYTKLEEVLQQIYNRGNSCPYYAVSYESGTHTQMSYGQVNDMIPQLIAWYKRWE